MKEIIFRLQKIVYIPSRFRHKPIVKSIVNGIFRYIVDDILSNSFVNWDSYTSAANLVESSQEQSQTLETYILM